MKRHPAFHDLSRDHHMLLLRAQELRRGTKDAAAIADRLVSRGHLDVHLGEEEAVLVPLLKAHADPAAKGLARQLAERNAILRATCAGLLGPMGAAPAAEGLHAHARWCEDTLLPWLQARLGEDSLRRLGEESAAYRRGAGAPVGPGAACLL